MVRKLNLDAMSVGEIWQLHQTVIEVLSVRLTAEKCELEKRLAQLRREQHQTLVEPNQGSSRQIVRSVHEPRKVAPKYRNPNEPSETWSGRGKRPRWLTQALLAGQKIDDFVIGAGESQVCILHEV
jgi:DNA-binding protein H-NS